MAAALATMVASMSRGKKAYLQFEQELSEAMARLNALREEFKIAIDADARSYHLVIEAYRQAKQPSAREADLDAALKQATVVPLGVAERASELLSLVGRLTPITSPNMKSDLTTAEALATAATTGALANVDINLDSIKDADFVAATRKKALALRG
jgi:glutamate formiminotransferase/formiminotetrahydrofolate cyclodeaminase